VRRPRHEPAAALIHRHRLAEIEVARRIRLQIEAELVEAGRDHHIIVEALVVVRFTVTVEIAQPRDLVPALRVDDPVDDLEAERLVHATRKAAPFHLREIAIDAVRDPHIAVPRRGRDAFAVRKKIEAAEPRGRLPRVVGGQRNHVDRIGLRRGRGVELPFDGERLRVQPRTAARQRREIRGRRKPAGFCRALGINDLES
jgi:hypothetical protein